MTFVSIDSTLDGKFSVTLFDGSTEGKALDAVFLSELALSRLTDPRFRSHRRPNLEREPWEKPAGIAEAVFGHPVGSGGSLGGSGMKGTRLI